MYNGYVRKAAVAAIAAGEQHEGGGQQQMNSLTRPVSHVIPARLTQRVMSNFAGTPI